MYVQKGGHIVMVDFSYVHVVGEVYDKIVAEDLATPNASWKGDGCNTTVVVKRIDHGFFPKWFQTTCLKDSLFGMYAKDINFGELDVEQDYELRLKKSNEAVLNGDLQVAFKLNRTFEKAENKIQDMLDKKDPLIMRFKSLKNEQKLLKVCVCLIQIIVRGT